MYLNSPLAALRRPRAALVAAILSVAAAACPAADAPAARLDRTTVPASGRHAARLTADGFGRYAVTVSSSQGVALQAVDRMAGEGPVSGEAGRQDGRLDLFLDRGEQKIVTLGAPRAGGQATLKVHAYRELHERPPLLGEHRLESASLGDFEQRSYWLEIGETRVVAIEAAGRHLADLRLWRDGTWLVAAAPVVTQSQARPAQPLAVARLTAQLEPGLYLLTAYGGPGQPWTEASDAKPMHLRVGIPRLGPAMRQRFSMSEFGVERFIVPPGPSHFRLELPSAEAATLQVGSHSPENPFGNEGGIAAIDKKSLPPVAEVSDAEDGERLVTVTLPAGSPFVLQHFDASAIRRFNGSGSYWISSIHAGHGEDSVGATAVLTRQSGPAPEAYLAEQTIQLGTAWHRRFNLLDELTLFVHMPAPGKLRVVGEGVTARYRVEPFLTSRPRDYQTPPWRRSGEAFDLDRGVHVLTVAPEQRGILDLHLLPPGSERSAALSPAAPGVRFAEMALERDARYTLYLNRQPGVAAGVVLRPLPIDLAVSLPVTQRPGETLTIPVSVPERGTLRALAEDGKALELALDDGRRGAALQVEPGRYKVTVVAGASVLAYSLGLEPARLSARTPLPSLPDGSLDNLPAFAELAPGSPRFLALGRRAAETFGVRVDKPGLYRFESTGLLQTAGQVRTRINPALFTGAENGVGRNFQIQRYLREGDYQLTLETRGETRGDLGVRVARTDVVEGGALREGEVARAALPAGQVLAYRVRIAEGGRYRVQAMGLGRSFEVRFEDGDGWPVGAPVQPGDLTEALEAGEYRLLILPQAAEARVLARVDRIVEPKRAEGHGPHRLALDAPVAHTWREPAEGAARQPDLWEFDLPAPARVTISLDNEMEATLAAAAEPDRVLARPDARRPWGGELPAGRYVVAARHSRRNNYVEYSLGVAVGELLAGESRALKVPAAIPVSVGADGLVELESFGAVDVRARLLDAAGETVARNDDRPGDWNFHIARRLAPGRYTLVVDPVGARRAQTTVSMRAPEEVAEAPLALDADVEIRDARVHLFPLQLPPDRNVLVVSAKSADAVGLALEGESGEGWVNLGSEAGKSPWLALPLAAERYKVYRLRAWPADGRSAGATLRAVAAAVAPVSESRWLGDGAGSVAVDAKRPELKVAMIALTRPGAFRLRGDAARLAWSDSGARTVRAAADPVIAVGGATLWLAANDGEAGSPGADRLRLPTGEQESLRLALPAGQAGSVDLQPNARGPSLVLAQARGAQPGVAGGDSRDPAATGIVPGEAVAVALPGHDAPMRVWNAANPGAPLELDLRQVPLRWLDAGTLSFGARDGVVAGLGALPFRLPGGPVRVRLSLSAGNAAAFLKDGKVVSTHWAGDEAAQETVAADADELWLLNAGGGEAYYGVALTPGVDESEPALAPGVLFERNLSTAGRLRVPVALPAAAAQAYRLHVRGAVQALWQEDGGRIEAGEDMALRGSGVLWLQHAPGALVAWVDGEGAPGTAALAGSAETRVSPPQAVGLDGRQTLLAFELEQPAMLHVTTSVPVVTQFLVDGQPARTEAHLFGADANLPAPAGRSRLLLRAVGTDRLSGAASIVATPALALQEGVGPEVMLASGGARLFAIELGHRGTLGIGVRASADVVRSVLYDERGAVRSEGVVQMPELAPGRYFLAVELPADSAPVRVQPVVLGLSAPDTRPPYDILRRYVEAKDGAEPLLYVPPPPAPPPESEAVDDEPGEDVREGEGDGDVVEESEGMESEEGADAPEETLE